MGKRTGPYETIFPAALTTGAWQNSESFIPQGQAVSLDATVAGAVGMLDLQVQRYIPAITGWADVMGASWSFAVGEGGTGVVPLAGVTFIPGSQYRVQFRATILDVLIAIRAFAHDGDPNAGAATFSGPGAGAGIGGVAHDATGVAIGTTYHPNGADGVELGTATDLQFDLTATGTAAPATARWRVEFLTWPSTPIVAADWADVTLSGYDTMVGADGWPSAESINAVATRRVLHFDNAECRRWRLALDVEIGISGPCLAKWRAR